MRLAKRLGRSIPGIALFFAVGYVTLALMQHLITGNETFKAMLLGMFLGVVAHKHWQMNTKEYETHETIGPLSQHLERNRK